MKRCVMEEQVRRILELLDKTGEEIFDGSDAVEYGFEDINEYQSLRELKSAIDSFVENFVQEETVYVAEYSKNPTGFEYYSRDRRIQDIKQDIVRIYLLRIKAQNETRTELRENFL